MVLDGSCHAFGNKDGVLFCDKEMENADNIPKGYYQSDCGGCTYDEKTHMLNCKKCKGKRNQVVEASLEVKEGCTIINDEGVLKCREDEERAADQKAPEQKEL